MSGPGFVRTLHFRITASVVVLVVATGGLYYAWVNATVRNPDKSSEERSWFERAAGPELAALAGRIAPVHHVRAAVDHLLAAEGRRLTRYDVELAVFDARGRCLSSSRPDSLAGAFARVDSSLLVAMSADTWDFSSLPDPADHESSLNRIFAVLPIVPEHSAAAPLGYLVANRRNPVVAVADAERDERTVLLQGLALLTFYAAASATIIMFWTTRRIRVLSRGVAAVAAGDLAARVPATSSDEIGTLGRRINALAERIESMVAELTQKESFQRLLVANVSHDLRTPLASLRGYIETLSIADDEVSDEERSRYLSVITDKLDHLDHLIAHVLVLSRIDSGQEVFRSEDFSLGELAETVLHRCEQASGHRDVAFALELESGLPDAHADPLQIGRVLQNLVENGVKFTPDGGRVAVRARRADSDLWIEVADTGIGIPPEDLPHVCERFYTVDRSRTKRPAVGDSGLFHARSSGLGLAIAARIIEGHGSRLEVTSVEGEGSVFGFLLPASAAPAEENAPTAL